MKRGLCSFFLKETVLIDGSEKNFNRETSFRSGLIAIQEINKEYQQRKTNQCNLKEGSARMPEQSPAEAMVKT